MYQAKTLHQHPIHFKLLGKFSKSVFKQSEIMYYYGNAFFIDITMVKRWGSNLTYFFNILLDRYNNLFTDYVR